MEPILEQIMYTRNLLSDYTNAVSDFIEVFKTEQSKLSDEWKYMSSKYMLHLASQNQESYEQYERYCNDFPSDTFNVTKLPKYHNKKLSNFNSILLVRRFVRNKNKSESILWQQKEKLRVLIDELKVMKKQLSKSKLRTAKETIQLIDDARRNTGDLMDMEFKGFDVTLFLQTLFIESRTITKNEFLSLITVDKSAYTKEYIDTLPDIIDYRTLEDAIFVHKIEDENDEWMFDIFYDQFWALRNAHKEEFKEMEDKLFDELGLNQLPTYSVSFDEFGDVADIKQNPPKLKLITNNESPILDSRILH
ncbi:hypothetical protein ACTQ5K_02855 [Niallia sp. Sow4_A1]|uniref:hypothetical protein n=1 Tax=Niallia sp. Sow4_A1 TaxID=3438793 RepID=UPI003F954986